MQVLNCFLDDSINAISKKNSIARTRLISRSIGNYFFSFIDHSVIYICNNYLYLVVALPTWPAKRFTFAGSLDLLLLHDGISGNSEQKNILKTIEQITKFCYSLL